MPNYNSTRNGRFRTTQWTQVLEACENGEETQGRRAFSGLCLNHWYPLYGYVRRKGKQPADAEDLTQGFLAQLLEKKRLADAGVHRSKGKFRTFLLTCFDHYLSNQRERARAEKRGGDRTIFSLDWEHAEMRYSYEPIDHRTPEFFYERAWAYEVLTQTLGRLKTK